MSEQNRLLAQRLLEKLGGDAPVEEIAACVSETVNIEIPGDATAFPWIGATRGRQAFADFIRNHHEMVQSDGFRVDEILTSSTRAIILGDVTATVKRTQKTLRSYLAIILTISDGKVERFQLMGWTSLPPMTTLTESCEQQRRRRWQSYSWVSIWRRTYSSCMEPMPTDCCC